MARRPPPSQPSQTSQPSPAQPAKHLGGWTWPSGVLASALLIFFSRGAQTEQGNRKTMGVFVRSVVYEGTKPMRNFRTVRENSATPPRNFRTVCGNSAPPARNFRTVCERFPVSSDRQATGMTLVCRALLLITYLADLIHAPSTRKECSHTVLKFLGRAGPP